MKFNYPECKTVEKKEDWFGAMLPDPYAWLREAKNPEVLDFVARENAFTDEFFAGKGVEEKIAALKAAALPKLPSAIVPWKDGYLSSMSEEGDVHIRILNAALEATGDFPTIPALNGDMVFQVTPCPKNDDIMALMTQHPGAARPTVVVYDMAKQEILLSAELVFSFTWSKADGCLYYSSTESDIAAQTCSSTFYRFDPATGSTAAVYTDDSNAIFGMVSASSDGAYIDAAICCDYSLARHAVIEAASGKAYLLSEDFVEWTYVDSVNGEHYYITLSEADHGALIKLNNKGERASVLPESEKLILESGFSAGGKLFVLGKENISNKLVSVETGKAVELPSQYASIGVAGEDKAGVFLKYESFLDAPRILRFDGKKLETARLSADTSHPGLAVEQRFAPSTGDGAMIPYYIVYKKGAALDGSSPALMYAYGGYNLGMPPQYMEMVTNVNIPKWVEAGGIYVHINNRGGNEYGPKWHEAGMLMNKRRCYEDFIGVAEQVIRDGWTSRGKIGISGCSNGGLLMSALVTMRPDLWGCVIDSVPHTDMIHFAEDDRGPMYITEYGNPKESREMFEYLLSYSPYHNVKKAAYPPTYIQTGELDNNVPPYHGKKLAARMQAEGTGDAPVLLRVLAEGSHDRGKGDVFWKTIAEMQVFLDLALRG